MDHAGFSEDYLVRTGGACGFLAKKKMGPPKRPQDDLTDPKLQEISTNLSFIWANIVLPRFGDVQHHLFVEFFCFKSLTISYTLSNEDGKGKHAIYIDIHAQYLMRHQRTESTTWAFLNRNLTLLTFSGTLPVPIFIFHLVHRELSVAHGFHLNSG